MHAWKEIDDHDPSERAETAAAMFGHLQEVADVPAETLGGALVQIGIAELALAELSSFASEHNREDAEKLG
jgi:hypothetical protein